MLEEINDLESHDNIDIDLLDEKRSALDSILNKNARLHSKVSSKMGKTYKIPLYFRIS